MSSWVKSVLLPAGKFAMSLGVPISIALMAHQFTTAYAESSDEQNSEVKKTFENTSLAVSAGAFTALVAAGTIARIFGGR